MLWASWGITPRTKTPTAFRRWGSSPGRDSEAKRISCSCDGKTALCTCLEKGKRIAEAAGIELKGCNARGSRAVLEHSITLLSLLDDAPR